MQKATSGTSAATYLIIILCKQFLINNVLDVVIFPPQTKLIAKLMLWGALLSINFSCLFFNNFSFFQVRLH